MTRGARRQRRRDRRRSSSFAARAALRARRDAAAGAARRPHRGLRRRRAPPDADRGARAASSSRPRCSRPADIMPVPCNPDAWRWPTRSRSTAARAAADALLSPEVLLAGRAQHHRVRARPGAARAGLQAVPHQPLGPRRRPRCLRDLLCCLPQRRRRRRTSATTTCSASSSCSSSTRSQFDLRAIKKSCVHIAQPDGAHHPVRDLQPVLPRRPEADCSPRGAPRSMRSSGGVQHRLPADPVVARRPRSDSPLPRLFSSHPITTRRIHALASREIARGCFIPCCQGDPHA